ncbi:MAG: 30S ribosomal protein S11 [Opitutales bacterium]|jgi:small subunit ribosomal protein S11
MSEDKDKIPPAAPEAGAPAPDKKAKAPVKKTTPRDKTAALNEVLDSVAAGSPPPAEGEGKAAGSPSAKDLLAEDAGANKVRRAKGSKNISHGVCHILATFNNTKVTFSDQQGNVISWSSSGKCNFRGSRKSTAYAAQVVTQDAGRAAISHGVKEITVKVRGPGLGRDSAIRALQSLGLAVTSITDVTPVPHNGCRPRKRRRV